MKVQFTVFKDNITVFKATHDVCQKSKKRSEVLTVLMLQFGIPTKCPMEAGTFCQNDKKHLLSPATTKMIGLLVGGVVAEAKIEHNDNAKYTIWKNHFQTSEGQFDVCDELKKYHLNANARHFLEHARIPRQCPVTKSEVCGKGFNLKFNYIKGCVKGTPIIKISDNTTVTVNNNCELYLTTCTTIGSFTTAISKNNVFKSNQRVIQNEINLCEKAKKADKNAKNIMRFLGLPEKCPVNATKICNTEPKKIDITKLAKFFPLAVGGPIRVETTLIHDTGKSCLMTEFEVTKIPKS
ncbi:unnamed protein product [Diamesa hyperborea]